jgi:hypothetical protein
MGRMRRSEAGMRSPERSCHLVSWPWRAARMVNSKLSFAEQAIYLVAGKRHNPYPLRGWVRRASPRSSLRPPASAATEARHGDCRSILGVSLRDIESRLSARRVPWRGLRRFSFRRFVAARARWFSKGRIKPHVLIVSKPVGARVRQWRLRARHARSGDVTQKLALRRLGRRRRARHHHLHLPALGHSVPRITKMPSWAYETNVLKADRSRFITDIRRSSLGRLQAQRAPQA